MMRSAPRLAFLLGSLLLALIALPRGVLLAAEVVPDQDLEQPARVRFAAVDLFIDSGGAPLAAWQVEFKATRGRVRIVGIENGEHPAFSAAPPYYDPDAMMNDRVILAQYSLARAVNLPTGRTRIATVHIQIEGDGEPHFEFTIHAAGDVAGRRIDAETTLQMREES